MANSERDDEFEAYLRRRARIDRRLKSLDRLEPPPELDRIIIGQARQAIQGAAPVTVFRGAGLRAPRWALPMGMAATILISLSILLDLGMRGAIEKDTRRALGPLVEVSTGASAERAASAAVAVPAKPSPSVAFARPLDARQSERKRSSPSKTSPWPPLPRAVAQASISSEAPRGVDDTANASSSGDSAGIGSQNTSWPRIGSGRRLRRPEAAVRIRCSPPRRPRPGWKSSRSSAPGYASPTR